MRELIVINNPNSAMPTVNARDLHEVLEISKDFSSWFKNQKKRVRLTENQDYILLTPEGEQTSRGGSNKIEYHLTLDAAKHIAMMSGVDKGFEVRDYFIACEKQLRERPRELSPAEMFAQSAQLMLAQERRLDKVETLAADQAESIRRLEAKQSSIEKGHSFFTVLAYCSLRGFRLQFAEMQQIGRVATRLSKDRGLPIDRVRDPRFGMVNSYYEEVLDIALEKILEDL